MKTLFELRNAHSHGHSHGAGYEEFDNDHDTIHDIGTNYQTFENGSQSNTGAAKSNNSHRSQNKKELATGYNRKIVLRDFFTVLALSFHAVFEGMAIGLEDNSTDIWVLFAAVATHKYVISFCVGLELYNADTPKRLYFAYMLVYALMSAIGIAIGIGVTSAIQDNTNAYNVTVGVLQGLAGGTLLYVCVFEILEREKSKKNVSGLLQLLFVILGFSTLMLVEMFASHEHAPVEEDSAFLNSNNVFNQSDFVPMNKYQAFRDPPIWH